MISLRLFTDSWKSAEGRFLRLLGSIASVTVRIAIAIHLSSA